MSGDAQRARDLFAELDRRFDSDPALSRRVVVALEKAGMEPRGSRRRVSKLAFLSSSSAGVCVFKFENKRCYNYDKMSYESERVTRRGRVDPKLKAAGWDVVPAGSPSSTTSDRVALEEFETTIGP